jgi:hypothetical protein
MVFSKTSLIFNGSYSLIQYSIQVLFTLRGTYLFINDAVVKTEGKQIGLLFVQTNRIPDMDDIFYDGLWVWAVINTKIAARADLCPVAIHCAVPALRQSSTLRDLSFKNCPVFVESRGFMIP